MFPVICTVGPLTIYSYGLMLAVAVIVCSQLLRREAGRQGISSEIIYDLVFWTVMAGIVGARLFFIFLNLDFFLSDPKEIFMLHHGGLAYQGGLILGALAAIGYLRWKKLNVWPMADLVSPYVILGQAIGRIGCFLNGCCYGRPVEWGIYFPVHHERLHPSQLYDTVLLLIAFWALKKLRREKLSSGQVFAWSLMLAGTERFLVEFFRGDHPFIWLNLSVFQWMSLAIMATGAVVYVVRGAPGKKS